MPNFWDHCRLDPAFVGELDGLQERLNASIVEADQCVASQAASAAALVKADDGSKGYYQQLEVAMTKAEASCRASLEILDRILATANHVASDFEDVTGRTNSLMAKCESLLDQQHTLQNTVEVLHKTLQPFNDIEEIAATLGIPSDSAPKHPSTPTPTESSNHSNSSLSASNLDPRSPEFQDMLRRLSQAIGFLRRNRDILDCGRYMGWLEKLQTRSTSLIGRAMRDLLEKAHRQCREAHPLGSAGAADSGPLEASALYAKFRGLSYRMKELAAVLIKGNLLDADDHHHRPHTPNGHHSPRSSSSRGTGSSYYEHSVLQEVRRAHAQMRCELLLPFLKAAWLAALTSSTSSTGTGSSLTSSSSSSTDLAQFIPELSSSTQSQAKGQGQGHKVSLGVAIRQACALLLRVSQLEYQLYDSLFHITAEGVPPQLLQHAGAAPEVLSIVEALANSVRDTLRPLIIKEAACDELCQLISSLSEDMKAQIGQLHISAALQAVLSQQLTFLMNDAKERLIYVAEVRLRRDVQMFEPLPSQLDYPDILIRHQSDAGGSEEVYVTWYPPLRHTLSLLSKLYNIIDKTVFESFALYAVKYCIDALQAGHAAVKRRNHQNLLHGDLFLIRHLLVLREQLAPFDMKLQLVEKSLDFSLTGQLLQQLMMSPRAVPSPGSNGQSPAAVWRFDQLPGQLLQLAQVSAPTMAEQAVDMKKELDAALKAACISMKASACKLLLGPMDAFLAKVTAFVGDIPLDMEEQKQRKAAVLLSAEAQAVLKAQAFSKAERIKEVLEQVQNLLLQRMPDFKLTMALYVDNAVARHVLLKPIVQELMLSKRRMDCVTGSCLDAGQAQRDAEQMLQAIAYAITSELASTS